MKSKNRDLFDGIPGYVAKSPDRARLLIGPFRSADDADTFADDLRDGRRHRVQVEQFRVGSDCATRHGMKLPAGVAAQPAAIPRPPPSPKPDSGPRGPRDIFQRDRDRIVHSVAFRRLRHKTQVFVAPDGDHFRVRLTHSIEVAQIGRTIARALGLNEDLTEALCLAHDLGHPPFGHAGEDALNAALADAGGFDHNAHTLRIVTRLETPYPDFDGLNLSWEALEGLAKHNGPVASPTWAMAKPTPSGTSSSSTWPSLEAQVAAIADDIAYDNHDIDDGLRSGLLDLDELIELPIVRRLWDAIAKRHPGISLEKRQRALVRDMIGTMVGDVLDETERRVADAGVADYRRRPRRRTPACRLLRRACRRGARAQALPLRSPLRFASSCRRFARKPNGSSPILPLPIATIRLAAPASRGSTAKVSISCGPSATSSPA